MSEADAAVTPAAGEPPKAFHELVLGILEPVLQDVRSPVGTGRELVHLMRELTGCRVAILWSTPPDGAARPPLVVVNPERRQSVVETRELKAVRKAARGVARPVIWPNDETPAAAAQALRALEAEPAVVAPLNVGEDQLGHLFLLGLPTEKGLDQVTTLLEPLGTVAALVLRHAIEWELQEKAIADRTALLEQQRARLALAIAGSHGAEWQITFDTRGEGARVVEVYFSPRMKAFLGFAPDELPNSIEAWEARVAPEDLEAFQQCRRRLTEEQSVDLVYRALHKNGSLRWIHCRGMITPPGPDGLQRLGGIAWDATHQRELEREGVAFRAFMEHVPALAHIKDSQGRYLYANPALEAFFGGPSARWLGRTFEELTNIPEGEEMPRVEAEVLRTQKAVLVEGEATIGGQRRRFILSKFPIVMPDGTKLIGGISTDVTELRETEAALKESQRRLATLVDNLPGAVYRCRNDRDWTMEYISEAVYEITGHKAREFINNETISYAEVIHPEDREQVWQDVQAGVNARQSFTLEYRIQRPDGDTRWVWERGQGVFDGDRLVALEGFITDITERKRAEAAQRQMEAQVREQQKLESIGVLAGGVAHEINNPINGVMNYAQIIEDELPPDSPLREFTVEIRRETERVATIVRDLLTFSRQEEREHRPTPAREIVESTLSLVKTIMRRDRVILEVDLPEELPVVLCHGQQMRQVLMNLITNARDALNIRYPGHDPDKRLRLSVVGFTEEDEPWIRFTVEDHGPGISPEVLARMFEPFYTTKGRQHGTGLGLAISRSIVEEHHGRLRVETQPGEYTRFHVEIPVGVTRDES